MKKISGLQKELVRFARKIAKDKLTVASSGNISAKSKTCIYIKASGASFEKARPQDFVCLDINRPDLKKLKSKPSCEYRLHIAAYKKRPDIKVLFHVHPLMATLFYSTGIKQKPVTMEFALYIGNSITAVKFLPPGTEALANMVAGTLKDHDAVVIKKHGLVTVGKNLQEAYLKALIIERECRAQFICKLFKKKPPYLTKEDMESIITV